VSTPPQKKTLHASLSLLNVTVRGSFSRSWWVKSASYYIKKWANSRRINGNDASRAVWLLIIMALLGFDVYFQDGVVLC
jgi:hypothetical protein